MMAVSVLRDVDEFIVETQGSGDSYHERQRAKEIRELTAALEQTDWNVCAAGRLLGLRTPTIAAKVKRLGIKRPPKEAAA